MRRALLDRGRSRLIGAGALAVAAVTLATRAGSLPATRADDVPGKKTLQRAEDPVVLTGDRIPKLRGVPKDRLRVYALRDGKLTPIPFQLDERTPELNYCWTEGPDPVKDVDEGRVDDDDELVFMARDTGDRAPADLAPPAGAGAREEIELSDPRTGERGWAYAFAFPESSGAMPPASDVRYVSVARDRQGVVFRGGTFEVQSPGGAGTTGRPEHIRLRASDGQLSREIVRHAARTRLRASYLFVHVDRDESEARVALGTSSIEGPVRIVAPVSLEAYLVWGNWVTAVRSVLFVYRSRWEQHARFSVPVNLDPSEPSSASLAVELAPGLDGFSFENEKNPRPVAVGAGLTAAALDTTWPSWNAVFGPEGAVVTRLKLDSRLTSARSSLLVEAPSGDQGARVGFKVDLTGLRKSDEGAPYAVDYSAAFVPGLRSGDERALVDTDDLPLVASVK